MTYPVSVPQRVDKYVADCVERMKRKARFREDAMTRVLAVREGRFEDVWPGFLPEKFPKSMIANFVDVAARDFAANLAPLPSLACAAGNMRSDADKRRAERRNRIAGSYWQASKLKMAMKWGADQYITDAFLPLYVEADYERKTPIIHVHDPIGAYFEMNRWMDVTQYAHCYRKDRHELAELYPEFRKQILERPDGMRHMTEEVEFIEYVDGKNVTLYIPEAQNLVLASRPHRMPYCPVTVALRPGVTKDPRGQFDDVLWIQLGAMTMAALTLEAGHKAVQAPILVPLDMQDLPLGPDAIMATDQPDKIGRLKLEVPNSVFALSEQLSQELSTGAGFPDVRMGEAPPGGTTGRGVSALQGGWSTQISEGQDMLGEALRRATEMCFDMDRAYWPNTSKTIEGTLSGESFQVTYTPGKDLDDKARVHVSYGFSAGQSSSATIVTMLQLRADGIISRDTFRRELPFTIDPDKEQRSMDEQIVEDGMRQGLAAGLQAVGQMITAGRTDVAMQFLQAGAAVIDGRREGKELADILVQAFQPPPAPPAPEGAPAPPGGEAPGPAGAQAGGVPGVQQNGLPQGVAPGQAGLPPGGQPSVTDLAAGFLASGAPNTSATVRHRIAA